MMNEHGKSDRPVVPAKSPNKAGQPAAEGTEGSGLTKGNLQQQNASRTPSRTDAPSALERIGVADKAVRLMGSRPPSANCSFRTDSIARACGVNNPRAARVRTAGLATGQSGAVGG